MDDERRCVRSATGNVQSRYARSTVLIVSLFGVRGTPGNGLIPLEMSDLMVKHGRGDVAVVGAGVIIVSAKSLIVALDAHGGCCLLASINFDGVMLSSHSTKSLVLYFFQ